MSSSLGFASTSAVVEADHNTTDQSGGGTTFARAYREIYALLASQAEFVAAFPAASIEDKGLTRPATKNRLALFKRWMASDTYATCGPSLKADILRSTEISD